MCGIAGTYGYPADAGLRMTQAMCDRMAPRGPDDAGYEVVSLDPPVALGNRRLSIIDPTPAGHQPMHDRETGTVIVFNGMIYNFRELRGRLESRGQRFVSECDTEVILRAYSEYGERCVHYLRGMWAFGIWDPVRKRLFLSRDRLGIKPLFYTAHDGRSAFASEVRALLASGAVPPRLSMSGIRTFLDYGAVSEPLTAIEHVFALPPGHNAIIDAEGISTECYWQPPGPSPDWPKSDAPAELAHLVEQSVKIHMVSDAPIGIFLSGGVDSSLVSALAKRHASDVKTISVVFDDPTLDEESHQLRVARALGTDHRALRLTPSDLLSWFGHVFAGMDQPAFDGLNTYTAARLASESGLKVAVSGLGADELLDGYGLAERISRLQRIAALPLVRSGFGAAAASRFTPSERRGKLQAWLTGEVTDAYELLRRLYLPHAVDSLIGPSAGGAPAPAPAERGLNSLAIDELGRYMRNVLLRDTDSMGMANSLEVRVPYLDHVVVEYVLSLPESVRQSRKQLLRLAFPDAIPAEIYQRPKRGFALPLDTWMRGPLRDQVDTMLTTAGSPLATTLDIAATTAIWQGFLARRSSWLQPWALFCLGRWIESAARP